MSNVLRRLGPVATISIAQLFGTSLWFSANSAADDLARVWNVTQADIGFLTSSVQAGFILGTLVMALGKLADRFPASNIFVVSAIAGAFFNACFALVADGILTGAMFRFLVGISLAGIYPVGMKLIVSWAPERAGQALAQLVAMLTLGTALPHALRELGSGLPWQQIILGSSLLALFGAWLIYSLGDGPYLKRPKSDSGAIPAGNRRDAGVLEAFKIRQFRAAAWGYFGHMWELYTFWTIVPLIIMQTLPAQMLTKPGVPGMSFLVIGVGAVGCLLGGALSRRYGNARVALSALAISGICATIFALFYRGLSGPAMIVLLLIWGASVVADSPQFSALSAKSCPPELVGSALALLNSIGFSITVVSIAATTTLFQHVGLDATALLLLGPITGLSGYLLTINRDAS